MGSLVELSGRDASGLLNLIGGWQSSGRSRRRDGKAATSPLAERARAIRAGVEPMAGTPGAHAEMKGLITSMSSPQEFQIMGLGGSRLSCPLCTSNLASF